MKISRTDMLNKMMDYSIWIILLVVALMFILLTPRTFLSINNLINILFHSSFTGLLVLALSITLLSGNLDLSVSANAAFTGMFGALFVTEYFPNVSPIFGIVAVLLMGTCIGLFNGSMIAKVKLNPFVQTLAMMLILRGGLYWLHAWPVTNLPSEFTFLGGGTIGGIPIAIPIFIAIFIAFHWIFENTIFGHQIMATGDDKVSARMSGINTDSRIIQVFAISGLLSALAGIFAVGRVGAATVTLGEGMVFNAFAGAILGGISMKGGEGKIMGALGGVLLITIISTGLILLAVDPLKIKAINGGIVLLAIVLDQFKRILRRRLIKGKIG